MHIQPVNIAHEYEQFIDIMIIETHNRVKKMKPLRHVTNKMPQHTGVH